MRRLIAAAVFGVGTVGALGCAGSATLVQKSPDGTGAVIALKAGGDMADAQKVAAKVLGGEVEIVGTTQPSLQQATAFDPANPNAGPKTDPGVMHVTYRKKQKGDMTGLPPAPGAGGMGLPGGAGMPTGAGMQQTSGITPTAPGTPGWMNQVGAPAGPAGGGAGMPGGSSAFGTAGGIGQPPAVFSPSK